MEGISAVSQTEFGHACEDIAKQMLREYNGILFDCTQESDEQLRNVHLEMLPDSSEKVEARFFNKLGETYDFDKLNFYEGCFAKGVSDVTAMKFADQAKHMSVQHGRATFMSNMSPDRVMDILKMIHEDMRKDKGGGT